jgi:hypothetical protein
VTSRRGRGRRDNGLDATLWSPLRDVDPRVGEHLLDLLEAVGIAAYLEPSADVGPYTRSVFLPSPPTDRLFVDRARTAEARVVVDEHAPHATGQFDAGEPARGGVPERASVRRDMNEDIDEDAEWARIVSAFEAEHGRSVVEEQPAAALPPAPHETPILDRPDEHYEPPVPPPLPAPAPASLYAVMLVLAGVVLVAAPGVLRLSTDMGLILGVAAIAGGVAMLVSRMRDRADEDGDDGAVV